MRLHRALSACFAVAITCVCLPRAGSAEPGKPRPFLGRWLVADGDFPAPAGTVEIPFPNGDFEGTSAAPGWPAGGEVVTDADAPQGKRYTRIAAGKGGILMTPSLEIKPGQPYFLSFWLRSPVAEWTAVEFPAESRLRPFGDHYLGIPDTGGRWRRLGFYVLAPADARVIRLQIQPMKARAAGQFISVDDVRLRTAGFEEMSAAYLDERTQLPPYDLSARPGDGRNLALSAAKWSGAAGVPGRPFLIWAVGSSWTNFQGDGYPLIRAIRERFHRAPPIVYRKLAGAGTPWNYARGWVDQFIAAENPDLVLTYTNGSPEGLDALLTTIRLRTTADILVPTLHFFEYSTLTDEDVARGEVNWDEVRTICRKHHAEFVENRRELADYLKRIGAPPKALLSDAVHQNHHGVTRIWDNIVRHVPTSAEPVSPHDSRERRIAVASPVGDGKEKVTRSDGWTESGHMLSTRQAGASLKLTFVGNRIDLIGCQTPGGGKAKVRIDGVPAEEVPAFAMNYILAKLKPGPLVLDGPLPGDVAPHAVGLGGKVVPQTWTITMTSDTGDYRLTGSLAGPDGEGNSTLPFRSRSGQITIDPALWRHNKVTLPNGKTVYGVRSGDQFTFDVERTATSEVNFRAPHEGPFAIPLVRNLRSGPHTLEIAAAGDGEVIVDSFYVYEPPLKD